MSGRVCGSRLFIVLLDFDGGTQGLWIFFERIQGVRAAINEKGTVLLTQHSSSPCFDSR
jgi:hypothetical protein